MAHRRNLIVRVLTRLLRPVVEQILANRPAEMIDVYIIERGDRVMPQGVFDKTLARQYGVSRAPGLRA